MRLYDLTEQYQDLLDMIEENPDNVDLQAMINGLEGKIEEKVENIVKVIKSLKANVKAIDDEIERLQYRKESLNKNIKYLEESTLELLRNAGLERIKGKLFTIWEQTHPPSVYVEDETLIPKKYFVFEPKLQKKLIMEDIKNGVEVPGVEIRQGKGLRFR